MSRNRTYTEKELVEGCIQNDRRCQEVLYRKFFPKMIQMCMRNTNDRDIAMEIVNNGMLKVFKKLHTFKFSGSLEGWIRKIVYHSLADYFKKHSKYLHFLVLEEKDDVVHEKSVSNLFYEDLLSLVGRLPDNTQEVFRLYAIEGFSHKEIGQQMGLSEGTSKWHLSSARKQLKEMIEKTNFSNRNNQTHAG